MRTESVKYSQEFLLSMKTYLLEKFDLRFIGDLKMYQISKVPYRTKQSELPIYMSKALKAIVN